MRSWEMDGGPWTNMCGTILWSGDESGWQNIVSRTVIFQARLCSLCSSSIIYSVSGPSCCVLVPSYANKSLVWYLVLFRLFGLLFLTVLKSMTTKNCVVSLQRGWRLSTDTGCDYVVRYWTTPLKDNQRSNKGISPWYAISKSNDTAVSRTMCTIGQTLRRVTLNLVV